ALAHELFGNRMVKHHPQVQQSVSDGETVDVDALGLNLYIDYSCVFEESAKPSPYPAIPDACACPIQDRTSRFNVRGIHRDHPPIPINDQYTATRLQHANHLVQSSFRIR